MSKEQNKEARRLPGFYIALCCCVLVIGIAGYFTERQTDKAETVINSDVDAEDTRNDVFSDEVSGYTGAALATPAPADEETYEPAEETVAEETVAGEETDIPVVSEPLPVDEYAVDNPDVDETAIIVSSELPAFILPVTGDIIGEYSDTLTYNSALGDWRAHGGIDIKADKGCSVQAASDGVIDEVSEDIMGKYVVLSHSAGLVTKYMGLENTENLTVGKEVKSGEALGALGDCKGENVTETHLHFEIIKDGECVNPTDYLPH